MKTKYRIIETEHADGSFTYHPEIGKSKMTSIESFPDVEYIWSKISIFPCATFEEAMEKIEKDKANTICNNKIVYEE
jgi:hypothetical protein